jgi:hypothetical protein
MVIPGNARPIGKTVRFKYVSAIFVFMSLVVAVGYTPIAAAAPAPLLSNTLSGLADTTVPAVTKAVTDTTAPITNAVSPALTQTVDNVVNPVSTTVVPAAVNTVDAVTTPVVGAVTDVVGPVVPAALNTVDNVAAPVTNTVVPAAAGAVDTTVTPVTTTVGSTIAPVTAPLGSVVTPVATTVNSVIAPTAPTTSTPAPTPIVTTVVRALVPVTTTLQNTTPQPTARFASAIPLFHAAALAPLSSPSQSAYSSIANFFNGLAGFFVGILPPSAWTLEGIDTSHTLSLWMVMLVTILTILVLGSSGGIYRKLRQTQRTIYLSSDDIALEEVLSPATAKIPAASMTAIITGVIVVCAMMSGT